MASKNSGNAWTATEKRAVKQGARDKNKSTEEIAAEQGRSVTAIRSLAQREGFSLRPKNR